ncbi:hypothetical protein QCA50_000629 [Cerrena zonata]|uniref:Ribosomal protein L22 n=1 Tax=Cerrena zonata TaxID=2478898 RepID=A0AAW0GX55_9APHY
MQSVAFGLRRVLPTTTSSRLALQPSVFASSSRTLLKCQWNSRRHVSFKNPLTWVQESLSPAMRDKASEQQTAAVRQEQIEKGEANLFDTLTPEVTKATKATVAKKKKIHTEHKYSTKTFKISHRKLNLLSRQIAGKPIDSAILQMMFSEKRASTKVKSMLAVAKKHAKMKGLDVTKLVVSESWVNKGPRQIKRLEPRGRGKFGIRVHPDSKICVVLREGKTRAQLAEEERVRKLKRIASAGYVREDVPLRNLGPAWAW